MAVGNQANYSANRIRDTWPLSLSYYTVPELDPVQAVHVAADCGCSHVGLRLLGGQPGGSEMPLMTSPAIQRDLIVALRTRGLSALDANTVRLVPETSVATYSAFLDVAAELGARHVLTTIDDPDATRRSDNFNALCEAAAARDLTVDLEFVPWQSVPTLNAADAEVRRCDHSAAGIALDALHFMRSGSTLADLKSMPRSRFRYLQLCDAPHRKTAPDRDALIHEAVNERLLPGEGGIDLIGLMRAFDKPVPVALEIPQTELSKTCTATERVQAAVQATWRIFDHL
jgi:sugar phosphate isomerase/epimerase